MKFKFKYETLLSYRKYLKEQAEMELAKANEQLELARKALRQMTSEYETAAHGLEQGLVK